MRCRHNRDKLPIINFRDPLINVVRQNVKFMRVMGWRSHLTEAANIGFIFFCSLLDPLLRFMGVAEVAFKLPFLEKAFLACVTTKKV
jgi:hypothetical protein